MPKLFVKNLTRDICEALHIPIDGAHVKSVTLSINPDDVVTIETVRYVTEEEYGILTKILRDCYIVKYNTNATDEDTTKTDGNPNG